MVSMCQFKHGRGSQRIPKLPSFPVNAQIQARQKSVSQAALFPCFLSISRKKPGAESYLSIVLCFAGGKGYGSLVPWVFLVARMLQFVLQEPHHQFLNFSKRERVHVLLLNCCLLWEKGGSGAFYSPVFQVYFLMVIFNIDFKTS